MDISTLIESLDDASDQFPVIVYDPDSDVLTLIAERCHPRLNEDTRGDYLTLYSRWDCRIIGFSIHQASDTLAQALDELRSAPLCFSHLLLALTDPQTPSTFRRKSFIRKQPLITSLVRLFGTIEVPNEIIRSIRRYLIAV